MAFDLQDSVAVLSSTPEVLRAFLADLPSAWLEADEGPDTWSPRDILGHFIHGEDTDWITRARMILEGAKEPFPPFDRFAQFRRFADTPVPELLDLFARSRRDNLATLAGWRLGPAELALPGTHPSFGPVTLEELLATWVVHDLNHIGQIARVMAKRYGEVVGPWKEYLPILTR
jgi:hypothetical protein